MSRRRLLSSAVFVCLAALSGFGDAPRALGADRPPPSVDASAWQAELGVLPIRWPVYEGADTFETIAFPYFHVEYAGRYFLDVAGSPVVMDENQYTVALAVAYRLR